MRLALALVLAAAGAAHAEGPAPWALLMGKVQARGSSVAIAGARIEASGGVSVITESDGSFQLPLTPGRVALRVAADGYEPLVVEEELAPMRARVVEYRLAPAQQAQPGRNRSVVRGTLPVGGGERLARGEIGLDQLPGTLGDPMHVVAMLPGVAEPVPLLPYFVVRGASPGTSGYFLDGMRVPELFHVLVGGGLVNGRLVDHIDFHPGAWDASYGRYAGGIVTAETRSARDGVHAEAELRPYDVSGLAEAGLGNGLRVAAAAHYGFPGPILRLFDSRIDVSYWDYQLRADWRGLTLEVLGGLDDIEIHDPSVASPTGAPPPDIFRYRVAFHRAQLRERARMGGVELEAAIIGGVDDASDATNTGVRKLALGARALARGRIGWLRLRGGVDGELSRVEPLDFGAASRGGVNFGLAGNASDSTPHPDDLGELGGTIDGAVAGAFVEAGVEVWRVNASLGVRGDLYHANGVTVLAAEPRVRVGLRMLPGLSARAGFGIHQQPPTFPVALPGVDTFALPIGLQRAWQGEVTIEAELPGAVTLTTTGFYNRFDCVNDLLVNGVEALCSPAPVESLPGIEAAVLRQTHGDAYGLELMLRRHAGRFTGWIAYTLSRSERAFPCGLLPSDFDQTHVLNVVAQLRLPWRLVAGARLLVATGRPDTLLTLENLGTPVRNNTRLPTYVQLDLRLDREWIFDRFVLAAFVELVNATYSETVFSITYSNDVPVPATYLRPEQNGFRWLLPSLGLRGSF